MGEKQCFVIRSHESPRQTQGTIAMLVLTSGSPLSAQLSSGGYPPLPPTYIIGGASVGINGIHNCNVKSFSHKFRVWEYIFSL